MARRVQTQKGADYFGVPIGAIITPDMEDDAKAKHGGRRAPAGSYTGSNQKRAGTVDGKPGGGGYGKESDTANSTPTSARTGYAEKGFKKPTITGPVPVLAGKSKFSAPEGSGIYKSPKHPGRVYVITPDERTHVITSQGELNLTPAESMALTQQVRAMFDEVVTPDDQDSDETISFVRLQSLIRMIEQAQEVGDDSQVKKLMKEFRDAAASFDPDEELPIVRERVKRTV